MSIQDDANYQRLTAALITAVEAWPTVRRTVLLTRRGRRLPPTARYTSACNPSPRLNPSGSSFASRAVLRASEHRALFLTDGPDTPLASWHFHAR